MSNKADKIAKSPWDFLKIINVLRAKKHKELSERGTKHLIEVKAGRAELDQSLARELFDAIFESRKYQGDLLEIIADHHSGHTKTLNENEKEQTVPDPNNPKGYSERDKKIIWQMLVEMEAAREPEDAKDILYPHPPK